LLPSFASETPVSFGTSAPVCTSSKNSLPRLVEQVAGVAESDTLRVQADAELRTAHADLARRLEDACHRHTEMVRQLEARLEARVEALDAAVAAVADGATADAAAAAEELRRRVNDLEKRLQGSLDAQTARMAEGLAVQRGELAAELRRGLAEVQVAATPSDVSAERLEAIAEKAERSLNEVEDLVELHSALDAGLGSLRSEIAAVRSSVKRMADSQADRDDRLDTFLRASLAPQGDQGRGRRRRKDEPSQQGSAAATDELLREYREIRPGRDAVADVRGHHRSGGESVEHGCGPRPAPPRGCPLARGAG